MMEADVVMVSLTDSDVHYRMTMNALESLERSEYGVKFNITLVENNLEYKEFGKYPDSVKVIMPVFEFNYNKCLNTGIAYGKADWITLVNNDVYFHENWFKEIIKAWASLNFIPKSFGHWNPATHQTFFPNMKNVYFGYRTSFEFTGWAITCRREIFKDFKLPEFTQGWYSDNLHAETLQKYNIAHVLVRSSVIDHLSNGTIGKFDEAKRKHLQNDQYQIYLKHK